RRINLVRVASRVRSFRKERRGDGLRAAQVSRRAMPHRFLLVSSDGRTADAAGQTVKEGHDVRLSIDNAEEREIAEGFVPRSSDWRADVDWADVVGFDDVLGHGKLADELRTAGKLVVGGSPYTDRLEDDRAFGQEELRAAGVS